MSSWANKTKQPPLKKVSYNEGDFSQKSGKATVVSAYYSFKSKYDEETYKKWIRIFLQIPCYLVFFTDANQVDFIRECRKQYTEKTHIILLNKDEWTATKTFEPNFWDEQVKKDPERLTANHTPELYKIWYEKKEFVRRAIELNPFAHDIFVWTDAGIVRDERMIARLNQYPATDKIPQDRIVVLNIKPFLYQETHDSNLSKANRIGGGVIAGKIPIWLKFSNRYDEMVQTYCKDGRFVGKDQSIIASLYLKDSSLFSLIKPIPGEFSDWFYLLFHFA
jgi:hypothetical protein